MPNPPRTEIELLRLHTLRSLQIVGTSPEEGYDRLTRIAQRLFDVPIALVTLLDGTRQWLKSSQGLEIGDVSLDLSFCEHALTQRQALVIPDTREDTRFHDNPLVTREPGIRFYAGQPLCMPDGTAIGVICLLDRQPRRFSERERALLCDLARIAENEFAAIQLATIDELTGIANRRGFEVLARQALTICRRFGRPASLVFFDIDSLKTINDQFGHLEGDRALIEFSDLLVATCREADLVARQGGDEFVVLLSDADAGASEDFVLRLSKRIEQRNATSLAYPLRFSVGCSGVDPACDHPPTISDLLHKADARMYADKRRKQRGQRGRT